MSLRARSAVIVPAEPGSSHRIKLATQLRSGIALRRDLHVSRVWRVGVALRQHSPAARTTDVAIWSNNYLCEDPALVGGLTSRGDIVEAVALPGAARQPPAVPVGRHAACKVIDGRCIG